MQNDYIYALLSLNVYNNPLNNLPFDWKEFTSNGASLMPSNDFYAFSYINTALKKIIIAFRGTLTLENYVTEDIEIAFNNVPPLFASHVVPYVEAVKAKATQQYPDFVISFTGHSLGAIFAELCAAKYKMHAVTFESPGSGSMIDNLAKREQLPLEAPVTAKGNIISYQAAISSINRHNPHLGTRIRLSNTAVIASKAKQSIF